MQAAESSSSPWPRRLLISGLVTLVIGVAGLASTLPSISDEMQPDLFNEAEITPWSSTTMNLSAFRIYSIFQNTSESGEIDGTVEFFIGEEELPLEEPSLFSGVGEMEYDGGEVIFSAVGWVQVDQKSEVTIISQSNETFYLVDQNNVSEEAFTHPAILSFCFSLVLAVCFIPLGFILLMRNRKHATKSTNVTLKTSDGKELSMEMDGVTQSGAVLTTDQIYAIAQIQKRAAKGEKINLNFDFHPSKPIEVPAPFADRPDSLTEHPQSQTVTRNEQPNTEPIEEKPKSSESKTKDSISEVKTQSPVIEELDQTPWKDWDEG